MSRIFSPANKNNLSRVAIEQFQRFLKPLCSYRPLDSAPGGTGQPQVFDGFYVAGNTSYNTPLVTASKDYKGEEEPPQNAVPILGKMVDFGDSKREEAANEKKKNHKEDKRGDFNSKGTSNSAESSK
ncbi:hypothetical protein AVEN_153409-1 [Araneus ventricosus]|uniref:Uncharacterized protein n=1 Tax=Araneus ventricosus TaxID=182803 RepID=A0A4Y2EA48_ARAVE|nr:hypothetical protein AVEN_153409-1 [Araneus ventricosus]